MARQLSDPGAREQGQVDRAPIWSLWHIAGGEGEDGTHSQMRMMTLTVVPSP
jgi:hypothetical protein